jgi:oligoribonuclease
MPTTAPRAPLGDTSRAPFSADHLVWLDMEMTGLDPATCVPLEIAVLVTNGALEVLAEGPNLIIHQPDAVLDGMDAWNTEHHGQSGLTAASRASTVSLADAEREVLAFLSGWVRPGASPLCGNSIAQDRRFLVAYLPDLEKFFHYRNIDVSTVKELVRRWYAVAPPAKQGAHRALDDIRESIAELRWYRDAAFREALAEVPGAPARPAAAR